MRASTRAWTTPGGVLHDLVAERPRLLSLDVFDTSLVRSCGPPDALFLWLGRRLVHRGLIDTSPEVFARIRMRADQEVWRRAGGLDSSTRLEDFYVEVLRSLPTVGTPIEELVAEELDLERQVARQVPHVARLIDEAHRTGVGVAFLSDTYLDAAVVADLLAAARLHRPGHRCFVSSSFAASKASGELFEVALEELGLAPGTVLHVGDDRHSDVAMPTRHGVDAAWLRDGRLTRYERLLARAQWETSGASSALAGASRLARLNVPAEDPHHIALRDVAAGVGAPFLVGYLLWLLLRARDQGLERLYFLARDGQILAQLAERLSHRLGLPVEARYLYVSRLTTNLPATFEADEVELGWVIRDLGESTLGDSLRRLGFDHDDLPRIVTELGLPDDQPVPAAHRDHVRSWLLSPGTRALVRDRAAQARADIVAYLGQEGLLDGTPAAIVDLGGIGSQVRSIHRLVDHAGGIPPHIFLVGLDQPEDAGLPREERIPPWLTDTQCYLYDDRREEGIRRPRGLVTFLQMFLAADHGTTVGYDRHDDGRLVPVLSDSGNTDAVRDWGLDVVHRTMCEVAEQVTLDDDLVDVRADLRGATCRTIDELWRYPTRDEARAWGAFPFEGAQASDVEATPLAAPYRWRSVLRGLAEGTFPDLGWQHWYEGSLRLSRTPLRLAGELAEAGYRWAAGNTDAPAVRAALRFAHEHRRRP